LQRGFTLLTFEQIKELIELVAERHLQGLEVERSGFRLKIDGQAAAQQVVYTFAPPTRTPPRRRRLPNRPGLPPPDPPPRRLPLPDPPPRLLRPRRSRPTPRARTS